MRAAVRALALATILPPTISHADWSYRTSTDEMRGEAMTSAVIESTTAIDQQAPYSKPAKLVITAVRSEKGSGFMFQLSEGQFSCVPKLCDVSMKFDGGEVLDVKAMSAADTNSVLHVQNPNLFVATAHLAKSLIVEVPVYRYGKAQFKFDVSGLEWEGLTPSKEGLYAGVGGQTWAAPYDPATGLVDNGFGEGEDRCYIDSKPTTVAFGAKPTKITHCYYQGRHYLSMVDFEFARMKQVISAVSKQLGKPELEIQEYVSWSDTEEKHLLSAALLASKKSKVATLQITYVPADNLVPPRKLVTQ
ncbi:hypothetical protein I5L59_10805 [Pseudomonas moraviensis]|uniref:hypothetical protein n=1 Tax=Pseudomonas fluorescens group TaxID=136843 RepID=UPI0018DA2C52|nr:MULTISPECIES: hypothetical protein [Pseudomonas fluorescens group]MBH3444064.1 hypothetical protein [Pseudomonas moraviensis]MDR7054795.1 hypothetical protein [Pseudomonas koreensis]